MKIMKLVVGLMLAIGLLGLVGCSKGGPDVKPGDPIDVDGVKVDLPKLLLSLESATQEQQAAARNMQSAFRYRQLDKALVEADKLANDATLNEEQKKLAGEVLAQIKQVMEKAPAPPAQ